MNNRTEPNQSKTREASNQKSKYKNKNREGATRANNSATMALLRLMMLLALFHAAAEEREEDVDIEGLLVRARWRGVVGGDTVLVPERVVVDIPADTGEQTTSAAAVAAAAAHLCFEAGAWDTKNEDDDDEEEEGVWAGPAKCEAGAKAALLKAAPEQWTLADLERELVVPTKTAWGNAIGDGGAAAAAVVAGWLREKDFGSKCGASSPMATTSSISSISNSSSSSTTTTNNNLFVRNCCGEASV